MAKKQKKYPPRDGASWQPGQQYGQYGQYGGWGGDPAAGMYGADPAAAQAAMPACCRACRRFCETAAPSSSCSGR